MLKLSLGNSALQLVQMHVGGGVVAMSFSVAAAAGGGYLSLSFFLATAGANPLVDLGYVSYLSRRLVHRQPKK